MKISELGEFGLIDLLAGMVKDGSDPASEAQKHLLIGIGDDAAAWSGDDSIQLATTDALIQDVHFTLDTTTWVELGWKSLAVNLSDIAAMGGLPRYALVSLALPPQIEVEQVTDLYKGMLSLAQQFDVAIIGGNMSSSPVVAINITVIGSTGSPDKTRMLTRSAARPGDEIAVTGNPGLAAAGLEIITKNSSLPPDVKDLLTRAFLTPFPRVAEGRALVAAGVRASIDISDGLLSDLRHICQASKVGARIEIDRLPLHPALKTAFPRRAIEFALSGGEDYELLFTAPPETMHKLQDSIKCRMTVIGKITAENAGEVKVIDSKGNPVDHSKMGWTHF